MKNNVETAIPGLCKISYFLFSLPLQEITTLQAKETVDRVHNQAVKLTCGGKQINPNIYCLYIDFLKTQILIHLTYLGVARYMRFKENHPNRTLIDSWVTKRIQK